MYKCEQCGCMTWDRVTLPDGKRVCEYCEVAYDAAQKLAKAAKTHRTRHHNNLAWLIKKDHVTIRNWAKKHGFSYGVVNAIVNRNGTYAEANIHEMSEQHFYVLMRLCDDGYKDVLVNEGYITRI